VDIPSLNFYVSVDKVTKIIRILKIITTSTLAISQKMNLDNSTDINRNNNNITSNNNNINNSSNNISNNSSNNNNNNNNAIVKLMIDTQLLECNLSFPEVSVYLHLDNEVNTLNNNNNNNIIPQLFLKVLNN
jgi:hypothetical protein